MKVISLESCVQLGKVEPTKASLKFHSQKRGSKGGPQWVELIYDVKFLAAG
jgi:hypothetical protein